MPNYEYPGDYEHFGMAMLTSLQSTMDGNTGVFHVIGTKGKGYMIHNDVARAALSPGTLIRDIEHGDFLVYPEETSGNLLVYELAGKGLLAGEPNRKEFAAVKRTIAEHYPDYAKEHKIVIKKPKEPTR
ncbi:hypothetical protein LJC32_01115 [Oscillospiraceae bacterium OttesenSCG-928-F05]|nr:hypothetical protein [Oscillospiraceae bacterium OttesenSCG-928-F05]